MQGTVGLIQQLSRPRRANRETIIGAGLASMWLAATVHTGAQNATPAGGALRTDKICLPSAINQPPDANMPMTLREQQGPQRSFAAANAERRRQIAADTIKLTKLAGRAEGTVEKAAEDGLSLRVIRQADEIERLAHWVTEKMKLRAAVR
jgi:hypothetical protein